MKKILFAILVIAISGMLATGQISKPIKPQTFSVEPSGNITDPAVITAAAETITKRLKNFGITRFEVKAIPGKNRVEVILPDDNNLDYARRMAVGKGVLEFCETWNREEIAGKLDAGKLNRLLGSELTDKTSAELGCTASANTAIVNDYLKTTGLQKSCRFLWNGNSGEEKVSLYAMKCGNSNGALLKGTDVESITISKDPAGQPAYLDLRFRQPVIGLWAEITKRNIGRSIAIVLDNKVLVAPVLKSVISGGNCQISGKFTEAELRYIAAMGSSGELQTDFKTAK